MARACFGILGTLEVRVADTPIDINAKQLRRLLCALLLRPGHPVSQATLVECMWPDSDGSTTARPHDPLATLRVYSSRLRRLLPAEAGPHGDVRGYRLAAGKDEVDAERFEELLSKSAGDTAQAATTLADALRLWRGPALAEFSDEPWAQGAAVRLNELRLDALERLHDARLALGEHGELCGELEHLVDEHPLRERMWAQLMLALYRSGRQADSLRAYQRLRTRLGEDLGLEPSRELVELEAAVLRQDSTLDLAGRSAGARGRAAGGENVVGGGARRSPTNLPAQLTTFVGRSRETTEIRQLATRSRLVTLAGAGGAGKTRLALQLGAELAEEYPGGVWLLELAALRQDGDVAPALASVLGIKPRAADAVLDALAEALHGEQLLLVLDNCEHLISACATLCTALVGTCPRMAILATSREPLGVDGESVYRVPSLGVPAPGAEDVALIAGEDAVQLFVDRARTHQPSFALDASNAGLVASLCRQLDGIPLALELAAARLRALSLAQIHARLDERFQLLVGGGRTRLPRQQTLTALIDWSYDLLDPAERWLLRRLAVFAGSFDLDSAVAVVEEGDDQWTVLGNIASLVDKSLVVAETSGATARYRLLETIRQYALGKLTAEEGEDVLARLRDAHAAVYVEVAEQAAPALLGPDQFAWLDRLELEFDNIRIALGHLLGPAGAPRDAMRLIVGATRLFDWRGHESYLLSATETLETRPQIHDADPLVVRVLLSRSKIIGRIDPGRAVVLLAGALTTARKLGETGLVAEVLNRLAWLSWSIGDYAGSQRLHAEAVESARESGSYLSLSTALNGGGATRQERLEALELTSRAGDPIGRYMVLCNLGAIALDDGDVHAARRYFEEALPIVETARPGGVDPSLLVNLGSALVLDGEHSAARPLYARALEAARRHLDERQQGYALFGIAICAAREGDPQLGATLFGAAEQHFERAGFALEDAERRLVNDNEERLRRDLGDESFELARARGRRLSKDEAKDLALGRVGLRAGLETDNRVSSPVR